MQNDSESAQRAVRVITMDVIVAALIFALGALVVYDSNRLGSSWDENGPQAGYFPFYTGLLVCISSAVVFVQGVLKLKSDVKVFVRQDQFRQVLVILLPSAAYVLGVQLIGIYVPSAAFIGLFMKIAGKYSWLRSAAVSVSVSVIAFLMFEVWFKIPLPKGPFEHLIGY
ncbi:MAG: tripartite tricarboxylate transporter TctB family protein [Betaproteobacteria bacterium]|nr:tripartite tricarboxylate transporter TctB family protein [Betaproteobacteria bacterium]